MAIRLVVVYTDGTEREMRFEAWWQVIDYVRSEGDHVSDYKVLDTS